MLIRRIPLGDDVSSDFPTGDAHFFHLKATKRDERVFRTRYFRFCAYHFIQVLSLSDKCSSTEDNNFPDDCCMSSVEPQNNNDVFENIPSCENILRNMTVINNNIFGVDNGEETQYVQWTEVIM